MILILEKSMSKLYLPSMWLCKIEMIQFFSSFSFHYQLPLGFSLSRLGFSWHRFGATGEQRVGQMDCSKTLLLSIPLFVFQTEQFLVQFLCLFFRQNNYPRMARRCRGSIYGEMIHRGAGKWGSSLFLIYNSYSSFKFWWGGIVRKMYDNLWEWDN